MANYRWTINEKSAAVVTDDEIKLFDCNNPIYSRIQSIVKIENEKRRNGAFNELFKVEEKKKLGYIGFRVENDVIFIGDDDLPSYLGERLKAIADEGSDYKYVLKFWDKVKENPSFHSVHQLFQFLERNHFPICPDGDFIAYKGVTGDFRDCHSGRIDNSPGKIVEIPRRMVDDDYSNDCSYGLHAGNFSYARGFGTRLVMVKINPRDAVAVNLDSASNKLRTCRYEVLKDITESSEPTEQVWSPKGIYDDEEDTDSEEYEEDMDLGEDDNDDEICDDCGEYLDDCRCGEDFEDDEPCNIVKSGEWSRGEMDALTCYHQEGKTSSEISGWIGRSTDAVRKKIRRMGLA